MRRGERRTEQAAARVVASVLEAKARWMGPGHTYDYELHYDDGSFDALEVTRLTDEGWRRLHGGLGRNGGSLDPEGKLKYTWAVWLTEEATGDPRAARRVKERIVSLLIPIDSAGIRRINRNEDFDWYTRKYRTPEIGALFDTLPVDHAFSYASSSGRPQVFVSPPGSAAFLGGEVVHEAVVRFLNDPDRAKDAAKLAQPIAARRRHLFVWIEEIGEAFGAGASVFGDPPTLTPQLPAPITDIWVACQRGSLVALWHSTPPNPWLMVPLP